MATLTTATVSTGTLMKRGGLALVLSIVANWGVLSLVLGLALVAEFDALSFPPVTLLTVLGVLGATVVYALLDRVAREPDLAFLKLAIAVLLLSFIPDIALLWVDADATVGAVVVLMVLHVTTAFACIVALTDQLELFPE